MMHSLFADLSNNNPHFDATEYRRAGHLMIALKATEGVGYTDPLYPKRAGAAHSAGLTVLHYHFARPDNHRTSLAEADYFSEVVKPRLREGDHVVLDVETHHPRGRTALVLYARQFARRVEELTGHGVIGYSYAAFLAEHGASLRLPFKRWWVAAYGPKSVPKGWWSPAWAHQFTDGASGTGPHKAAGVGSCDLSRLSKPAARYLAAQHGLEA